MSGTPERHTILVVDDDVTSLRLIQNHLKDGYHIAPARSGAQALEYLAQGNVPDLILLDIEMPQMNGYELIERLKETPSWRHIPVIFLTGREGLESELKGFELGAVDYLTKPAKRELIRARIAVQLELEMYRKELSRLVDERTSALREKTESLERLQGITLAMMAQATEFRDVETGQHIERTKHYVAGLIECLPHDDPQYVVTPEEAEVIAHASQLHDIGKVAIPDAILLKRGKLDPEEWAIMRTHPRHGADLLEKAVAEYGAKSLLDVAREVALGHHEKWDGSGYPQGLAGLAIPLSARLTAVADVYDALRSVRPYKEGFPHEEAMRMIAADSGAHFDPVLVEAFLKHCPRMEAIFETIQ